MASKMIIYAPRKLTPTDRGILAYISEHQGQPCSKTKIADHLGRNRGTVDRLISRLRADGLIVCKPTYDENGGQRANTYYLPSKDAPLVAQVLK